MANPYVSSDGVRVPARGWWEKKDAERRVRAPCMSRGMASTVVGEATIGRHAGRPVFNVPLDLSNEDTMLVKLALF